MKKCFVILVLLMSSYSLYSQNFNEGYKKGHAAGYCNNDITCVPPVVLVSPVPRVGEQMESFLDGYNRGIIDGFAAHRLSEINNNITHFNTFSTSPSNRVVPVFPQQKLFTPDLALLERSLKARNQYYAQKQSQTKQNDKNKKDTDISKSVTDFLNADSMAMRLVNSQLLRNSYLSMEYFPQSLRDGVYKVKRTLFEAINADPNFIKGKSKFRNGEINKIEDCYALVENNKVVYLTGSLDPNVNTWEFASIIKYPNQKKEMLSNNDNQLTIITNSPLIDKGTVQVQTQLLFLKNGRVQTAREVFSAEGIDLSEYSTEYLIFIDYLEKYNYTQKSVQIQKETPNKSKANYTNDNYYYVKATDGVDFFDVRKVFISNNRVIKYYNFENKEYIVQTNGQIIGNIAKISLLMKNEMSKKDELTEFTLYF